LKNLPILLLAFITSSLISCNRPVEIQLNYQIINHVYYAHLSSASGVSVLNGNIVLVGDDIPWMVELTPDFSPGKHTKISAIDSVVNGRTPYPIKADYECMETFIDDGITSLIVLSSGSKKDLRDTAILLSYGDSLTMKKRNIRPLYELIKSKAEMGNEEINIEGLAISNDQVLLFHRGNISGNFAAGLPKNEFLEYLKTGGPFTGELKLYHFDLPSNDGIQSGFSGACMLPDEKGILFTASMENTQTVTGDGEITGSFIGFIPVNEIQSGHYIASLIKMNDKILIKKLEGICVQKMAGNEMEVIAVSDNDNGTSDLYQIKLKIAGFE
jgi:hypothetical protein